jgi:hypothetical protein
MQTVRRYLAIGRFTRPILPFLMKSPMLRRRTMRVALHGDRVSAARAVSMANDSLGYTIIHDVHNNADEYVASFDPVPRPITIVWAENDAALPD